MNRLHPLSIGNRSVKPHEETCAHPCDDTLDFERPQLGQQFGGRASRAGGECIHTEGLAHLHQARQVGPGGRRRPDITKPPKGGQDVFGSFNQAGSVLYERMTAPMATRNDRARHRQHVPSLLERHPRGDQRPAPFGRFHDDDSHRETADDAVAERKVPGQRGGGRRQFRNETPVLPDSKGQGRVLSRVHNINTTPEDGDRRAALFESALVGGGIDALRQAADHDEAGPGEVSAEATRHRQPRRCGVPGSNDGHADPVEQFLPARGPEHDRRVDRLSQSCRVLRSSPDERGRTKRRRAGQRGDGLAPRRTLGINPAILSRFERQTQLRYGGVHSSSQSQFFEQSGGPCVASPPQQGGLHGTGDLRRSEGIGAGHAPRLLQPTCQRRTGPGMDLRWRVLRNLPVRVGRNRKFRHLREERRNRAVRVYIGLETSIMRMTCCLVFALVLGVTAPAYADRRSDAKAQVEFGITVAQRGLWKEAAYRWERATELDPSYSAGWNNLGIGYEQLGRFDDARRAYEKALEVEPSNTYIRNNYDLFREIYDRQNRRRDR